jgi:hypothetical protein
LPSNQGTSGPNGGTGADLKSTAPATPGSPGTRIQGPRGGSLNLGTNPNGGINIDVTPGARSNDSPALGSDIRQNRQDLRQDIRDRRDERIDARQDLRTERMDNRADRQNDRWRFVLHNGEWWYWQPNNSWVYWRDSRWLPYDASTYQPFRYRAAYRGPAGDQDREQIYIDESGRRYRRDYSPDRRSEPGQAQAGSLRSETNAQSGSAMQGGADTGAMTAPMSQPYQRNTEENNRNTGGATSTGAIGGGVGGNAGAGAGAEIGGAGGSSR